MRWIKPVSQTAFKLTVSTPLNYMKQAINVDKTLTQLMID